MSNGRFYITTPIYYPSAKLHIGHAYCTTIADALARYHRQMGEEVFFLTGSDEHGQKIQRQAEKEGVTPLAYVDKIVAGFKDLWEKLNISHDDFIRTSEDRHIKVVQEIFRRIYAKGDIYKGSYKGLYCTPCESYWTEHQLDENGCCPDCHRPVEEVSEEAYFFKISKYADRLLEHINAHPEFIRPTSRRNEMISFIKQGLEDLCISRTSFDWGIPVPGDEKHVIYVWFDALSNYLTPIGFLDDEAKFAKFWPADVHLVGKEIVRFHSIIWPCILMALDLPLPKVVYGHGWLIVDGDKMSKSKGNVVDPIALIEEFGEDAIRYFLLREITLGQDGNISRDALIARTNADLANDLGNLLHRTLNMIKKFQGGKALAPAGESEYDAALKAEAKAAGEEYVRAMNDLDISAAIKRLWSFIGRANKYIDETAPWLLAKDSEKRQVLANTMYNLLESLRLIGFMVAPYMPGTAKSIGEQLNLPPEIRELSGEAALSWGLFPAGTVVGEAKQLFPRIEEEKGTAPAAPDKGTEKHVAKEKKAAQSKDGGEISIEDFGKIHLRVVKVLTAEPVPNTDKLLKLTVDLGNEKREIVSGIAAHYSPNDIIGKNVVMVINLKPAKIRGIISHGMILAASKGDDLELLSVDMPVGSLVK